MEEALPACPTVDHKIVVAGARGGWLGFDELVESASEEWTRPVGAEGVTSRDIMLVYFTSGTTGMAKAVCHNFAHPLGHILTAKYWQQVEENTLHMSVTDSGWAKFGWGEVAGQWIAGATVFAYDMEKFVPTHFFGRPGLSPDHLLRTSDHVPVHVAGGRGVLRSFEREELRDGGRAA